MSAAWFPPGLKSRAGRAKPASAGWGGPSPRRRTLLVQPGYPRERVISIQGVRLAAALACILAAFALGAPVRAQRNSPNVVFILADDLGWKDLGCTGSSFYETPNLDRLAKQGVRYTQAYSACTVCSPTRAAIMTGRYPARLHLTDYIPGARRGKLNPAPYLHQLPLEEVTIAEALKEGGYRTGHVGKWHLGGPGFYPDRQGFDVNIAGCEKGSPPSYFSPYRNPTLTDGPPGEFLTDRLTDEAVKFIESSGDRPFFLYLPHHAVHTPLQAKPELVEKYRKKAAMLPKADTPEFLPERERQTRQVQNHAVYAAMLQSLDESVGRVVKALEDRRILDNTLVIFTSDNGGLSTSEGSPTSNVPLRAGKGWHYEGGVRVPLIIHWPGGGRAGTTDDRPVISTDFYPTILDVARLSARPKQHLDGVSMVPGMRAEPPRPERALYWHYPHYGNQGGAPGGAVRVGDWKLVEWFEDMSVELFNLRDDPGEHQNLADRMPEKAAALRQQLHDWRRQVDAAMPTPNPDYKP